MKKCKLLVLCTTVFLVACKGINLDVSEFNTFDPSTQSTYSWAAKPFAKDSPADDKMFLLDSSLRQVLNRQLSAKGYRMVDNKQADFVVSYYYFAQVFTNEDNTMERVIGENKRWMTSVRFDDLENIDFSAAEDSTETASLEVSFADSSGKVIWRATAKKAIENQFADRAQYDAVIARAVSRMLLHLPKKQ